MTHTTDYGSLVSLCKMLHCRLASPFFLQKLQLCGGWTLAHRKAVFSLFIHATSMRGRWVCLIFAIGRDVPAT